MSLQIMGLATMIHIGHSVRVAKHFFVNFDIFKRLYLAYYWVYLDQTWEFCKAWSALYDYVEQ